MTKAKAKRLAKESKKGKKKRNEGEGLAHPTYQIIDEIIKRRFPKDVAKLLNAPPRVLERTEGELDPLPTDQITDWIMLIRPRHLLRVAPEFTHQWIEKNA